MADDNMTAPQIARQAAGKIQDRFARPALAQASATQLAKVSKEHEAGAAQEAREAAAERVRNSRSMPDGFIVGGAP